MAAWLSALSHHVAKFDMWWRNGFSAVDPSAWNHLSVELRELAKDSNLIPLGNKKTRLFGGLTPNQGRLFVYIVIRTILGTDEKFS